MIKIRDVKTLAYLGIISAYIIFVTGYIFTQITTPIISAGTFHISDLIETMPLILGRGFFAAVAGGACLPAVLLTKHLSIDVSKIERKLYYPTLTAISAYCWILVIFIYHWG